MTLHVKFVVEFHNVIIYSVKISKLTPISDIPHLENTLDEPPPSTLLASQVSKS